MLSEREVTHQTRSPQVCNDCVRAMFLLCARRLLLLLLLLLLLQCLQVVSML
jgi:hypothetical protein